MISQLTSGAAPSLQLTLEVFLVRNCVACGPHYLTAGQRRELTCGISRHNEALWREARRREVMGAEVVDSADRLLRFRCGRQLAVMDENRTP